MNKPKKVLYVDHTPFAGGAQLVLAEHIAELNRQSYDPYVVCSQDVPDLLERYKSVGANVKLLDFPRLRAIGIRSGIRFLRTIRKLRQIIRTEKIDLVVSNTTRASYVVTLACIGSGIPVVWWVRDFLYPKILFTLLKPFTSKMLFVSKAIRNAYVSEYYPKAEVVYVASSLYEQLPGISKAQLKSEKQRWGIADTDIVVGFMGRLVADKGVEEVVEAAKLLHNLEPNIKFIIVGTGKNQMNDVELSVQQSINDSGLSSKVIMTGYQSNEALYYSLFDIFVLPTRDGEPFATSVVQAMMAGAAVIGSNAGGTPELVEDGVTGLLFEPRSAQELASNIARLANDPKLRQNIAENGNARVLQYHREEIVTDQVEAIFNQVLTKKH